MSIARGIGNLYYLCLKPQHLKPEYFIAKRISMGGMPGRKFSGPVIKVSIAGIILGMTVMILSMAIGSGFKKEIRDKISGFGAHIQVVNYDFNLSYEPNPIRYDSVLAAEISALSGIKKVQRFGTKPGLIKTDNEMQGVLLKGISPEYDLTFLNSVLVAGTVPQYTDTATSNEILISETMANMLNIELGQQIFIYFFQEQIRVRRLTVAGIYNTHLSDLDKMYVIADIKQIQRLNDWGPDQIAGYEILIDDFNKLNERGIAVYDLTGGFIGDDGTLLRTLNIKNSQPQIFAWLDILDMNIVVIIVLIVLIAGFNMISGLLILILERTNMIGILKAMGIQDMPLRKIFLYLASGIAIRGLVWGNIAGLSIALLQKQFGIFKLDPANYFLDTVPILINPLHILLLNLGAILAIFIMMIGPSYLAAKIAPVKAIKFD